MWEFAGASRIILKWLYAGFGYIVIVLPVIQSLAISDTTVFTEAVSVQPFPSVIVTVCMLFVNPVAVADVSLLSHRKLKEPVPPEAVAVALPFPLSTAVVLIAEGSVIVIDSTAEQPVESLRVIIYTLACAFVRFAVVSPLDQL